jgi:adenylate cyclase
VVKTTGDGFLIEFPSPVEAVRCAVVLQETLSSGPLQLRIGINLGDIIFEEDGDVYGDGVNIAARLEQLADPGGVCISGKVYDEVEGKIDCHFVSRGEQQVKNITKPVRVYTLASGSRTITSSKPKSLPLPDKPSIAVLPSTILVRMPSRSILLTALSRTSSQP